MLVLRRRVGEAILVDGDVEIEVIEISRSRVKLGVRAPFRVSVIRRETLAVSQENQLASDLIASRGQEGVGDLVQMLNRQGLNQSGPPQSGSPQNGLPQNGLPQSGSPQTGPTENASPDLTDSVKRTQRSRRDADMKPRSDAAGIAGRENPHPA
jgi:carbon storage regulator